MHQQGFSKNNIYFRRVVGLPGETVEVKNGKVYINDRPLPDTYNQIPPGYEYQKVQIPANAYFVLGNNPDYKDYKLFGAIVPKDNIKGQVIFRLWPPQRFGKIE